MSDDARLNAAVTLALQGAGQLMQKELVEQAVRIHDGIAEKLRNCAFLFKDTPGDEAAMAIAEMLEQAARAVKR